HSTADTRNATCRSSAPCPAMTTAQAGTLLCVPTGAATRFPILAPAAELRGALACPVRDTHGGRTADAAARPPGDVPDVRPDLEPGMGAGHRPDAGAARPRGGLRPRWSPGRPG